ncbi:brain and acute leukemia cytoplasmic protein [Salvelinus namaycush]|uniref:Brain and acute leukemia cytoplasmic protein n=1 Tax=Salvelinus namaycush TaxID=8040 RepID=A0A8U0P672_SALNM|nr:brain and acute leukemia cytoplasmic protein [Salvelinus namaycush]
MGCGGSRTDALEPRCLDSRTKETESTWLTRTDTDIPLSSIQSMDIPSENSSESFVSEKTITAVAYFFDDGMTTPTRAYLKVCSAMSEAGLDVVKPNAALETLPSQQQEALQPSPVTTVQRRSILRTEEITKWQDNRMSTEQVTITVTRSR